MLCVYHYVIPLASIFLLYDLDLQARTLFFFCLLFWLQTGYERVIQLLLVKPGREYVLLATLKNLLNIIVRSLDVKFAVFG